MRNPSIPRLPDAADATAPDAHGRRGVPSTLGRRSRGRGDAFEWHEGEKGPPPPKYDSHRLDDDGRFRFGFQGSAPR
jgi:hypothetical protein